MSDRVNTASTPRSAPRARRFPQVGDRGRDFGESRCGASNAPMGKLRVGPLHIAAEQARALAQALLAAADEYEHMAGYDQITVS